MLHKQAWRKLSLFVVIHRRNVFVLLSYITHTHTQKHTHITYLFTDLWTQLPPGTSSWCLLYGCPRQEYICTGMPLQSGWDSLQTRSAGRRFLCCPKPLSLRHGGRCQGRGTGGSQLVHPGQRTDERMIINWVILSYKTAAMSTFSVLKQLVHNSLIQSVVSLSRYI